MLSRVPRLLIAPRFSPVSSALGWKGFVFRSSSAVRLGSLPGPRMFSKYPPGMEGHVESEYEGKVSAKLRNALPELEEVLVADRSGGCGDAFVIYCRGRCFAGKSRIQKTRMVQDVLKEEVSQWHAVSIVCDVGDA